jgi:hypothetical protein
VAEQSSACETSRGKYRGKSIQKEKKSSRKELFLAGSKLLMFKRLDK